MTNIIFIIHNLISFVHKNQGSSLLLPAYGRAGQGQHPLAARQLRWHEKLRRRKSEGGAGIPFPPTPFPSRPARALGWEAARPCVSKEAKPAKIVSLIEKIFCARPLKEKEIFAGFVRRQAASRWGGFLPVRAENLAQNGFALRSVIATNLNIANFAGSLFARSPRLRRGFAHIFPYISAQNQTGGQNQKSVFYPAGGGSGRRSRQSKNTPIRNLLKCFCFPIFFRVPLCDTTKPVFNPALFPPKVELPKATYLKLRSKTL